MLKAYNAVKKEGMSRRRAAIIYGVPKSTLDDRLTGKVLFGSHSGPPRYLNDEEEEELVSFLFGCASVGYAKTRKEVIAIVEEFLAQKGTFVNVSNGWWESFRKRHPTLTLRTAEKFSYARSVATDPVIIDAYFDLLEETLVANDLMDKPAQIFNCDETGMPLNHKPSSVIAKKHPRTVTSSNKKQITVLACCNAAGYTIPPLVLFGRKNLNHDLTVGEVPGTMYGLTANGWMDGDVMESWFTHHFLTNAPASRPLLLLLDGHSTHYNLSFIRRAACDGYSFLLAT